MARRVSIASKKAKASSEIANQGDRIEQVLSNEMTETIAVGGRTKRTAVRLAIMNAIHSGDLSPGDILPSEKRLTELLRVSLGTTQAALRQLQQLGVIVRRRGDGSRVASTEPLASSVWHFRFVSKSDGTPLRISRLEIHLDIVDQHGDWAEYITDCERFIRIRRSYIMSDGTHVGAEMFIDESTVPGLMEVNTDELDMTNIRPYLEEKFGIVTAGATHLVKTVSLDRETAETFRLTPKGSFFEIHAKAYSNENRPVYFQRIYVSVDECALSF
ncbi:GntR family transcriptional regulator [Pelagibius sp. Alg239-R121]|uniref:GntR family transcriptional regulator n=1 Tax=Pelagibius sp. Alg239-R121 TaxID=2993448 RepID=UPI0024A77C5C|nr:GntR family transcriptional regulator [Pelagibius sp. Alg239-R121]